MDTKSLSLCQVPWAQELSCYHFWINYRQGKANGAADALSYFPQRSSDKDNKLQGENIWILHCLQSSVTNASLLRHSFLGLNALANSSLLFLHQVFIYRTHGLLQLRQLWDMFRLELANKDSYKANIGSMRFKLQELQKTDSKAHELRK